MQWKDVVIGDNCHIFSHAVILDGARIGSNCKIFPGAVISGIPQDLKFAGEITTAEIGNNTTIRECVTINRGTKKLKVRLLLGTTASIMAYAHVAHDCILKDHIIIGNATQIAGGGRDRRFCYCERRYIGTPVYPYQKHVMIQGGSRVGKDIPPYTLIGRDPIAYCGINIVGLRRRGYTNDQVFLIQDIYRTLYTRGLNNSDAINCIESEYEPSIERDLILGFIKSSSRGIVRGSMD